jgi:hypothetical protein
MVGLHPAVAAAADDDVNDHYNKGCKQLSNRKWEKKYCRGKGQPTCSDGQLFAYLKMILQHTYMLCFQANIRLNEIRFLW